MISSKFPKSFRGAGDLVMFYDFFFVIFRGLSKKITKHHQIISTPIKLFGNLLEINQCSD